MLILFCKKAFCHLPKLNFNCKVYKYLYFEKNFMKFIFIFIDFEKVINKNLIQLNFSIIFMNTFFIVKKNKNG